MLPGSGKIRKKTPPQLSQLVSRFRESSQIFVVQIFTKNLAFNLSGAFFFVGLGCSLKWWYKDQLLIALLKQNLPALSEPQEKISWKTGEHILGEQNYKVPLTFADACSRKYNDIGIKGESKNVNSLTSKSLATLLTFIKSPISATMPLLGSFPQEISSIDKDVPLSWGITPDYFIRPNYKEIKSNANLNQVDNISHQQVNVFNKTSPHLIKRIDFYANHAVVKFNPPWQKKVYQRFIGIFSEPAKIENSQACFARNIFAEKFANENFSNYSFWKPIKPVNWYKLSARGLCTLNEKVSIDCKEYASMFNTESSKEECRFSPNKNNLKLSCSFDKKFLELHANINRHHFLQLGGQKSKLNITKDLFGFFKNAFSVNKRSNKSLSSRLSSKGVAQGLLCNQGSDKREKKRLNGVQLQQTPPFTALRHDQKAKEYRRITNLSQISFPFNEKKKVERSSIGNNLTGHTPLLSFGASQETNPLGHRRYSGGSFGVQTQAKHTGTPSGLQSRGVMSKNKPTIIKKFSYPLELTTTLTGWQPSVNSLLLNSYLDEIPYKLESILTILPYNKTGQTQNSPYPEGIKVDEAAGVSVSFFDSYREKTCSGSKQPIEQNRSETSIKPSFIVKTPNETFLKKLQFIQINQLLRNELQLLVNKLPLHFVDQYLPQKHNIVQLPETQQSIEAKRDTVISPEKDVQSKTLSSNLLSTWSKVIGAEKGAPLPQSLDQVQGQTQRTGGVAKQPSEASFNESRLNTLDASRCPEGLLRNKEFLRSGLQGIKVTNAKTSFGTNDGLWQFRRQLPLTKLTDTNKVNHDHHEMLSANFGLMVKEEFTHKSDHRSLDTSPADQPEGLNVVQGSTKITGANKGSTTSTDHKSKHKGTHIQNSYKLPEENKNREVIRSELESEKLLLPFKSGKSTDSLDLLNYLGLTFNNLSPLSTPPVLLPINNSASFWTWKQPILTKQFLDTSIFNLRLTSGKKNSGAERANLTEQPRYSEGLHPELWFSHSSLKSKSQSKKRAALLQTIFRFNPTSLIWEISHKPNYSKHISLVFTQDVKNRLKKKIKSSQLFFCNKVVLNEKKFVFENITGINPVDKNIDFANRKSRFMSGYVYPDIQSNSLKANLHRGIPLLDQRYNRSFNGQTNHQVELQNKFYWALYPKSFQQVYRFLDQICLASVKVPITGTSTLFSHYFNESDLHSRNVSKKVTDQPAVSFLPLPIKELNHHLAYFPGFTRPNQFLFSLTQIAHGLDASTYSERVHDSFSRLTPSYALSGQREAQNESKEAAQGAASRVKNTLANAKQRVDELHSAVVPITNEKTALLSNDLVQKIVDCNSRKTAYHGIVVERNNLTKDFQPLKDSIKGYSLGGTSLLGSENPFTDRQSHFFGQRQLSTIDTNSFQRDYLRQLGKETLAQSNLKGWCEAPVISGAERAKILSFSKTINSFSLKKRKYTYLLKKKDHWHLLFQEQLRTVLEDPKKYPPLGSTESKEEIKNRVSRRESKETAGRIKISAPLVMARFPKRLFSKVNYSQSLDASRLASRRWAEQYFWCNQGLLRLPFGSDKGQKVISSQKVPYPLPERVLGTTEIVETCESPKLQHNYPWRPLRYLKPYQLLSPTNLMVRDDTISSTSSEDVQVAKLAHGCNQRLHLELLSSEARKSLRFFEANTPDPKGVRGKESCLGMKRPLSKEKNQNIERNGDPLLFLSYPQGLNVVQGVDQFFVVPSVYPFGVEQKSNSRLEAIASETSLPETVNHYPFFAEKQNFELNYVPRLNKSSLSINNNSYSKGVRAPFGLLHSEGLSVVQGKKEATAGHGQEYFTDPFLNLQWFTHEALTFNSWAILCQWSFLLALLFWVEQILVNNVFPSLSALEQLLLGANGLRSNDRANIIRVSKNETPKFQDIAGVDGLLGELAELVLFLRGHKKRLWSKKSSYGVLLTGPPGTGKTFLVRALANQAGVPVLILSAGALTANRLSNNKPSWSIRHAFRRAKQLAPCILFIDEIDALGRSRGEIVTDINEITADTDLGLPNLNKSSSERKNSTNTLHFGVLDKEPVSQNWSSIDNSVLPKGVTINNEINRSSLCQENRSDFSKISSRGGNIKVSANRKESGNTETVDSLQNFKDRQEKRKFGPLTQLLVSMDGVQSLSGVLVMGATNRPESLDKALTRPGRFERIIRVEKPAEEKRIEILKLYSHNLGVQQRIPWSYLANRTVGLTAADLAVAMNYSSLKAIAQGSLHTIETIEYGLDSISRFPNSTFVKKNQFSDTKTDAYSGRSEVGSHS